MTEPLEEWVVAHCKLLGEEILRSVSQYVPRLEERSDLWRLLFTTLRQSMPLPRQTNRLPFHEWVRSTCPQLIADLETHIEGYLESETEREALLGLILTDLCWAIKKTRK